MTQASDSRAGTAQRTLAILGATGSVGRSTLDVVSRHPREFRVDALTAHKSAAELVRLCISHRPRVAVLSGCEPNAALRQELKDAGCPTELLFGDKALLKAVEESHSVMAAIVGAAGLEPTIHAASLGKRVLLANKEALVMAGPVFMSAARKAGAVLLPIDSEHNAVFQCMPADLQGRVAAGTVRRILLTASGGPFRMASPEKLATVTPDEACAHPNWSMGRKISVDSATMMNKGLEVIEARWLFDVQPDQIEVVIHPQSIIHSLVDYVDGSVLAQLSNPDMRVPIAHALAYPRRMESGAKPLDLGAIGQLSFEPPDPKRFPCLGLAYAALRAGGSAPAILNAANEIAVEAFLGGRIGFTSIPVIIEEVMGRVAVAGADTLGEILEADRAARFCATSFVAEREGRAA